MGNLSNDCVTSKIKLEESRHDIEGVGMETEKEKKRCEKCIWRLYGTRSYALIDASRAMQAALGKQRSAQGWQNSLRTYRRCRHAESELEARWDSRRHPSWSSKSILGNWLEL